MSLTTQPEQRDSDVFAAVGFGTTVLMWAICYLFRLPGLELSSPVLGGLVLAALVGGTFWAGRWGKRPLVVGLCTGLIAAGLNLMIVGSITELLAGKETSIATIFAGVLCGGAAVGAVAGWLGGRFPKEPDGARWLAAFPKVAPVATFLLVILGGIVTSTDAGLAVYDWPTTEGSNMFLFPLSKMVGGVFYEHTHRLFGGLVGLTTLALAVHLIARDPRRWLKVCGVVVTLLVIVQGYVGGARVFEADVAPGVENDTTFARALAVAHGVGGQLILAALVAIAAATSRTWRRLPRVGFGSEEPDQLRAKLVKDQRMATVLVPLVVSQLFLGAMLRHFGPYAAERVDAASGGGSLWVMVHMVWAFAVLGHGLFVSARTRALYVEHMAIQRSAQALLVLLIAQLLLGFAALVVTSGHEPGAVAVQSVWDVLVPTAHQALGAAILAVSVVHAVWLFRAGATPRGPVPAP